MKLAVFYHCCLSLPEPLIEFDHASHIMQEQMQLLHDSGLGEECEELYVGASGGESNVMAAATIAPEKAVILPHPPGTCGELPTLCALQEWLPGHDDWGVCYFHNKGAMYKGHVTWDMWRHCMMNVVVRDWRSCVQDLQNGFDCAGPHWLTPQRYPGLMLTPYFGGTFWWAKGSYLSLLPRLAPDGPSRYEAEAWIGRSPRPIKVRGYADHWPGIQCR